jgi:predicted Fe-Mo cluster-binding NifX family protein
MKIAIPASEGKLFPHFGHCREVAMVEVDPTKKTIVSTKIIPAPPHEPGSFPAWFKAQGANVVITGGMGQRALDLFTAGGIQVVAGAPVDTVESTVTAWLQGRLNGGKNSCNHGTEHTHTCDHSHE